MLQDLNISQSLFVAQAANKLIKDSALPVQECWNIAEGFLSDIDRYVDGEDAAEQEMSYWGEYQ